MTIGGLSFYLMLTVIVLIKLIVEIALLALVAQAVVGVMAGAGKANNTVYRLLQLVARPWVRVARWVSPRVVLDRHVPLLAFFGLLLLWCAAVVAKVSICLQIGVALCK